MSVKDNIIVENELYESDSDNSYSNNNENYSDDEDKSINDEDDKSVNDNIKKRGRKKKIINDQPEKVQKKRGRKPKIKEQDEIDKIPKKRGRKPKEKVYSVKELPKTFFEENKNETFILHLPIKNSDLNNNIPQPNINNENSYFVYNNIDYYNINNNNLLPTQENLLPNNNLNNLNNLNNSYNNILVFNDNDVIRNNNNINSLENNINLLENNIEERVGLNNYIINKNEIKDDNEEDEKTNKMIKKKLKNILYEFINANNDKVWPEKTNIYCWWCCHPFNCMPCALPEYYKKDKFYVNGCFCSFNCTASYNFSKNDDNVWERYSLLNLMYKKMYDKKFIKINLAPPREILKIFGGYMNIDEFRENSYKNEKTFVVINPPLISIIPKIEENVNNITKNSKNNLPIVNEVILAKTQSNLKLKRNKPVTNPNNTLQSFMDLKII
jgi:hypothetical protein